METLLEQCPLRFKAAEERQSELQERPDEMIWPESQKENSKEMNRAWETHVMFQTAMYILGDSRER